MLFIASGCDYDFVDIIQRTSSLLTEEPRGS